MFLFDFIHIYINALTTAKGIIAQCVCVYFLGLGIFYDEEAARLASTQTSPGEHVNSSILALLQLKQGQHFDQLIAQLAKSVGIFKKKIPFSFFSAVRTGGDAIFLFMTACLLDWKQRRMA